MGPNTSAQFAVWGVRLGGAIATVIGGFWLIAWWVGSAAKWSAAGEVITMKTNAALCLVLGGVALILLGVDRTRAASRKSGVTLAVFVLSIGALTLSENVFGSDLGIDQLLATEAPGALGVDYPNRMGVPASSSFVLLGAGLLALLRFRRFAALCGVAVCLISFVPLIGYLHDVAEFYSRAPATAIAFPTVLALLSLGAGLVLAAPEIGPMKVLTRSDAGGKLFRQGLPVVVLGPVVLGLLTIHAQAVGWVAQDTRNGIFVVALVIVFTALLWRSAARLSRTAQAHAAAAAELRESEERFRMMADGTPVPIWVVDAQGHNRFVNRAYSEFFGVSLEAAQGEGWHALLHPDDFSAYSGAGTEALRERKPFHAVARVLRHDKVWRWIESYGAPHFSANGEFIGLTGSSVDITEQKAFQAELERLVAERTAKLQELVGELEHFSYTITHDMRAPLRAMQGFAEIMAEDCAACQDDEEAKGYLRRIRTAASRMDSLITDALNYNRAVRHELTLSPVDAGALLRGMLDSYPEFQPSRAQIEIAGEIPLVLGNEAGLTQCFSNLLGNAVKFVKPGQQPKIRIWAERTSEEDKTRGDDATTPEQRKEAWVRIWVEDEGVGIPESMQTRVFEMFSRGHQSYEGTGIGLALVRKVAERMGGRTGVESMEGRGSRFWLELKSGERRRGTPA